MKISFVASHTQKKELLEYYKRIVRALEERGIDVYSGRLFDTEDSEGQSQGARKKWYKHAMASIKSSDVVVVEISYPSTANVGHELTYALELGKPVVALYKKDRDPLFLQGREDDKLIIMPYEEEDLEKILNNALDYATEQMDTRFNFFISPKIGNYLDWISKHKKTPRAVYLRRLIEKDMAVNKEYSE